MTDPNLIEAIEGLRFDLALTALGISCILTAIMVAILCLGNILKSKK